MIREQRSSERQMMSTLQASERALPTVPSMHKMKRKTSLTNRKSPSSASAKALLRLAELNAEAEAAGRDGSPTQRRKKKGKRRSTHAIKAPDGHHKPIKHRRKHSRHSSHHSHRHHHSHHHSSRHGHKSRKHTMHGGGQQQEAKRTLSALPEDPQQLV